MPTRTEEAGMSGKVIRFFIWSMCIAVGTTWGMLGQMTFMQWKLGRVAAWRRSEFSALRLPHVEVLCLHLPDAFCDWPHTKRLCSGTTGCSERWWQANIALHALKQVWTSRIKGVSPRTFSDPRFLWLALVLGMVCSLVYLATGEIQLWQQFCLIRSSVIVWQVAFGPVFWSIGFLFLFGFFCLEGSKGAATPWIPWNLWRNFAIRLRCDAHSPSPLLSNRKAGSSGVCWQVKTDTSVLIPVEKHTYRHTFAYAKYLLTLFSLK